MICGGGGGGGSTGALVRDDLYNSLLKTIYGL